MSKDRIIRKASLSEEERIKESLLTSIVKKYCVKRGEIKIKDKLRASGPEITESLSKDVDLFNATLDEDLTVPSLTIVIKEAVKEKASGGMIYVAFNPLEEDLSNDELEILKKVFIKYDESNTGVIGYYKNRDDAETYKSFYIKLNCDQILLSLSSIHDYSTNKTAYQTLADAYKDKVNNLARSSKLDNTTIWNANVFYDEEKGTTECRAPNFSLWFEHSLKRLLTNNKNRLNETIYSISTDKFIKCTNYYDEKKNIYEMPTPEWDDWCEVFTPDEKQVVMAWLYSIIDYKHKGRQCLWFCDEGYTGKSRFFDTLTIFFNSGNNNIVRVIGKGVMDSQFAMGGLIGARLIVYPDCKNMSLVRQEKIHNMASNDTVSVEAKFQMPYSAKLNARVIVASNDTPAINTDLNNEITRIIFIKLKKPSDRVLKKFNKTDSDGNLIYRPNGRLIPVGYNLTDALLTEMPGILYKSREIYSEMCPKREEIVLPESVYNNMINELSSPDQVANDLFVSEHLKITNNNDDYIIAGELKRLFEEEVSKDSLQLSSLIRYLEMVGVKHKRLKIGDSTPKVYTGVRILTPKDRGDSLKIKRIAKVEED